MVVVPKETMVDVPKDATVDDCFRFFRYNRIKSDFEETAYNAGKRAGEVAYNLGKRGFILRGFILRVKYLYASPQVFRGLDGGLYPLSPRGVGDDYPCILSGLSSAGATPTVSKEILTMASLRNCFAADYPSVVHLSCHGHKDYLAGEDPDQIGIMKVLNIDEVIRLLQLGSTENPWLFIAASCSFDIGKALFQAGISIVICYRGFPTQKSSEAFIEAFYRALGCGRSAKEAFDYAKAAVLEKHGQEEAGKSVLFDRGDVDVLPFAANPSKSISVADPQLVGEWRDERNGCVGRQVALVQTINALKEKRFVVLSGPAGIGKAMISRCIVRYLEDRREFEGFWMDGVFSTNVKSKSGSRHPIPCFDEVFEAIRDDRVSLTDLHDELSRIGTLADAIADLNQKRCLLVFDGKGLSIGGSKKLKEFAQLLLGSTQHLRILVIFEKAANMLSFDESASMLSLPPNATWFEPTRLWLGRLDLKNTVDLFCKHVPLNAFDGEDCGIGSRAELKSWILDSPLDEYISSSGMVSFSGDVLIKHSFIFGSDMTKDPTRVLADAVDEMLGKGVPKQILCRGRGMTKEELRQLERLIRQLSIGEMEEDVLMLMTKKSSFDSCEDGVYEGGLY